LSKLEEIEIKAEHDKLSKERRELKSLLKSDEQQWERISDEIKKTRELYSKKTELGRRRSSFADAPAIEIDLEQAMIEKEPITVILSEKGWIRALKGHIDDTAKLEFKQGDSLKRAVKASTTDKLLLLATNGKIFTLAADQLPGGRGHGEPLRLMIDLEENNDFVELFVHQPGRKLLIAATSGHGFIVPEDEVVAMTRKGKQVLNVDEPAESLLLRARRGDSVAAIGENRKMLIFPLAEVNEMTRGKGIILQRYKDGGLSDVRVFQEGRGLYWLDPAGRTFTLPMSELRDWLGQARPGRRPAPRGFPSPTSSGRHSDVASSATEAPAPARLRRDCAVVSDASEDLLAANPLQFFARAPFFGTPYPASFCTALWEEEWSTIIRTSNPQFGLNYSQAIAISVPALASTVATYLASQATYQVFQTEQARLAHDRLRHVSEITREYIRNARVLRPCLQVLWMTRYSTRLNSELC
jgi:hypothetical protein